MEHYIDKDLAGLPNKHFSDCNIIMLLLAAVLLLVGLLGRKQFLAWIGLAILLLFSLLFLFSSGGILLPIAVLLLILLPLINFMQKKNAIQAETS